MLFQSLACVFMDVVRADGLTPNGQIHFKRVGPLQDSAPRNVCLQMPMRLNIGSVAYCTGKHACSDLLAADYVVFRAADPAFSILMFLSYAIEGPEWRQ